MYRLTVICLKMVLILDQQVGLFSLVRDLEPLYFKQNIFAHAALAKAFDLPVVMSTSAETGTYAAKL